MSLLPQEVNFRLLRQDRIKFDIRTSSRMLVMYSHLPMDHLIPISHSQTINNPSNHRCNIKSLYNNISNRLNNTITNLVSNSLASQASRVSLDTQVNLDSRASQGK